MTNERANNHHGAAPRIREAFDLWQAGRLAEAAEAYEDGLLDADPNHYATPMYHGEFANVLSALGRDDEALAHLQTALALEQAQGNDDSSGAVGIARYILGEHLLKLHRPTEALEAVLPSIGLAKAQEALLRCAEADAHWQIGDRARALDAARLALSSARTQRQRERVRERLKMVLAADSNGAP